MALLRDGRSSALLWGESGMACDVDRRAGGEDGGWSVAMHGASAVLQYGQGECCQGAGTTIDNATWMCRLRE